jgi:SAM-dependent methyltransferase
MSFDSLMAVSQRLNASLEALAALGAELRLRQSGEAGDPRVRQLLQEVVRELDPQLLEGVDAGQQAAALGFIQAFFRQAVDLLEHPARAPGWVYDDPLILQSQGQASRLIARVIEALGAERPELAAVLREPGAFLDVGTGVGWLAIEAARSWPNLHVVGIDPWEPSLKMARANVAASGMAERIELRRQGAEELADREAFTLVWLSGPFLAPAVMDEVLERTKRALKPGGWMIFGLYAPPPDPLGQALTTLRIARGGGHPWTADEIQAKLGAIGFEQVSAAAPLKAPVLAVVDRKP